MDPLTALQRAVDTGLMPPKSSILLAVSGGADSMALLHASAAMAPRARWRLAIGHVHHGWRGRDAERDLAFVGDHARRLGLAFLSLRRDARAHARLAKLSPEAAARQVRYRALAEMARDAGATLVATAHQEDDRIESYLLALARRGGLALLAGPRLRRADGVVRPFLRVTRTEVLEFLRECRTGFRRDSTNGDLSLPRNRVRLALARGSSEPGEALPPRDGLVREIDRLGAQRDRIRADFETLVAPRLSRAEGSIVADAVFLSGCPPELLRHALEQAAGPFAAPGRPPLTGREREQILSRISSGLDFRFEAGRRIRFERRGPILTIGPCLRPRSARL